MRDEANDVAGVDVGRLLDTSPFKGLPLLVAVFTTLTLIFDGFDIQSIAFAAPRLLAEWGIDKPALRPVFAAGLLGMAFGALSLGAFGDYFGRRRALIASVALVAVGSWLSTHASSPGELGMYRFVTGIGLGGTLPNATALIAEFSPLTVRNIVITVTVVGVPIGGMLGAGIAAQIIPAYGWRAIFAVGAILPAALTLALILWLPESPRFMAARRQHWPRLANLLNRVTRSSTYAGAGPFYIREPVAARVGVAALLTRQFRHDTLVVWLIFTTNVFAAYAIFGWLPTVLSSAGLPLATAIHGSLIFNLGGVLGSLAGAVTMNRLGSRPVLTVFGLGAVLSTFGAAFLPLSEPGGVLLLLAVLAAAGVCINGMQVGMYSVAAHIYPTSCRASALGWALGIARIGGILSSYAVFGGGAARFFGEIAVVLLLTLLGVALLRGHMLRPAPIAGATTPQ